MFRFIIWYHYRRGDRGELDARGVVLTSGVVDFGGNKMGYVTSGQPLQSVKTGMASALQPLVLGRRPVARWIDHLLLYALRTKKVASLAPRLGFIQYQAR